MPVIPDKPGESRAQIRDRRKRLRSRVGPGSSRLRALVRDDNYLGEPMSLRRWEIRHSPILD